MKYSRRNVMIRAHQLRSYGLSMSEAMKLAWAEERDGGAKILVFQVEISDPEEPDRFEIIHASSEDDAWMQMQDLADEENEGIEDDDEKVVILEIFQVDPVTYDPIEDDVA